MDFRGVLFRSQVAVDAFACAHDLAGKAVAHVAFDGDAGGDIDKLEVLDGVPREIVRTRDSIRCYLPESRVVKVDRRTAERDFPALLPERVSALARHYDISLGENHRIAGFDCQAAMLAPKA